MCAVQISSSFSMLGLSNKKKLEACATYFSFTNIFFFPCACHWRGGNRSYWAINRKDTLCGKRAFNRGCYMSYKRRHVLPGDLMCEPSTDFNAADEILTTEALSGATRKWTDWHTRTHMHTDTHACCIHMRAALRRLEWTVYNPVEYFHIEFATSRQELRTLQES